MGGGGAGAISHSAYMETVHKDWLGVPNSDSIADQSIVRQMHAALAPGASPFLGSLAYNPDTDLSISADAVSALKILVDSLSYIDNAYTAFLGFKNAVDADIAVLDTTVLDTTTLDVDILDTAVLDTATLDTLILPIAVLDTFLISDAQVVADVLAFSTVLESDLNEQVLPKFKASMMSINAVYGSAFILGEALLRKEKLRQVAVYTADLRYKLNLQANEINAKFISERRERDTRFQLMFQEITSRFKTQYAELTARFKLEFMQTNAKFKMQHKDKSTEYNNLFREITARFKIQFQELTARFKLQNQEVTAQFKNQRWVTIRGLVNEALNDLMKQRTLQVELARFTIESNRLKIIAKTEQAVEQLLINEHNAKWNLEVFAFGTTVLGGIGSGAFLPGKKSKAVSALAGGLAGAAGGALAGAAIGAGGGPYGAAIGLVLGATAGALST